MLLQKTFEKQFVTSIDETVPNMTLNVEDALKTTEAHSGIAIFGRSKDNSSMMTMKGELILRTTTEGDQGTLSFSEDGITFYDVSERYKVKKSNELEKQEPPLGRQAYVLYEFIRMAGSYTRSATDIYDTINNVAMVFSAAEAMKTDNAVPVLDDVIKELLS